MKGLLLIDGNSIGFAAHNTNRLTAGALETQGVFGIIRTMRDLLKKHPGFKPIVYWDGKSWRKQEVDAAEYKANRDVDPKVAAMREAYRAMRPTMARALVHLGISQRSAQNMEADDLIAITVAKIAGKTRLPAYVVSGDRDLLQLVQPGIAWYDPGAGRQRAERLVTHHDFAEYTGYESPDAYVEAKALIGDASDNLKGVDGIGEKSAALILGHWGSVGDAITDLRANGEKAIPPELTKFRKKLLAFAGKAGEVEVEGVERFLRNWRLMRLRPELMPTPAEPRCIDRPFDARAFERLCDELAFLSILRDFDGWTRIFREHDFNRTPVAA